jgi:serine/threonine-protein kinase
MSPGVFAPGQVTADRYRIIRFVGEGGMGQVYQAQDEVLERVVALKTIRPEIASVELTLERFKNEVKLAQKIADDNVCRMFDLDHRNEPPFLTMEFLEGETLAARLRGNIRDKRRISVAEAYPTVVQMARGLGAAHRKGVIHGDFKPGNVILTRTESGGTLAKVTDFGLARTQDGERSQGGLPAGTPTYMAPEQLRGAKASVASDIYALGLVMYEMVTGAKPAFNRLSDPPPSPRTVVPSLDPKWDVAILRCLAREPRERFQSTDDVLAAIGGGASAQRGPWHHLMAAAVVVLIALSGAYLASMRTGSRAVPPARSNLPAIQSLAVLPLENLSGAGREHFADAMTDALITGLSRIKSLRVISRTSVTRYKNLQLPVSEIARELNVDAVIEGSVFWVGRRVRIQAKLIDGHNEKVLWASPYDSDTQDVLKLQNRIARQIAVEINVRLSPQEAAHFSPPQPVDPEAFEAYSLGRFYWNKRTEEGFNQAIQYFQQAIQKDPNYAQAYAGLADCYIVKSEEPRPGENAKLAERAAARAIELDETLAEAHISLASVSLLYNWDWPRAKREFERGIELNPGNATAHEWYGYYLAAMGQLGRAVDEMERARALSPLSLAINVDLAQMLQWTGRYDDALIQCQKTLALDPSFARAHERLGQVYAQRGRYDEAIAEFHKALDLDPASLEFQTELARANALAGHTADARAALGKLIGASRTTHVPPYLLAIVCLATGAQDQAFAWLDKAFTERSDQLLYLNVDPVFDGVRSERRFRLLIQRVGLPLQVQP